MLSSIYSLKYSRSPRSIRYLFQRLASEARKAKDTWRYSLSPLQIPEAYDGDYVESGTQAIWIIGESIAVDAIPALVRHT